MWIVGSQESHGMVLLSMFSVKPTITSLMKSLTKLRQIMEPRQHIVPKVSSLLTYGMKMKLYLMLTTLMSPISTMILQTQILEALELLD